MSYDKLFANGYVEVLHDPHAVGGLSIAIGDGEDVEIWLPVEIAVEVAKAILTKLDPVDAKLASECSLNEAILRLAAAHKRQVSFKYAKGDGSIIETRSLVPDKLIEVDDHLTFVGYDPDRDDVRAYRVDRMKGAVTL